MARKKHLINVHTSTGTTAPTGASLYLGEIAVQHTPNDPALWIKVGSAETSTEYEKFIGKTEIINLLEDTKILGSGYTYSGLSYINSSTTIADAFSALTNEMLKDEQVVAAALNDLNVRVDEISAATGDNTELLEYIQENEEVVAGALNNLNERVGVVETHMTGDYIPITGYQTATGTSEEELSLEETDTVNEALGKLQKQMLDNEESIAAGLNDLNTRLDNVDELIAHNTGVTQLSGAVKSLSAAMDYGFREAFGEMSRLSSATRSLSSATISLSGAVMGISAKTSGVLTVNVNGTEQGKYCPSANTTIDLEIIQEVTGADVLLTGYELATGTTEEELAIAATDTVNEAFGKIQKQNYDNEAVIAGALNDLDERITTLEISGSSSDDLEALSAKVLTNEYVVAAALNDLNARIVEISGNTGSGGGTETDPIFSSSPAATITQEDIDNWNQGGGGGGEGAVTAVTVTGTGNAVTNATFSSKALTLTKGNVQATISDLATIRSNAASGMAAYNNVNTLSAATTGINSTLNTVSGAAHNKITTLSGATVSISGYAHSKITALSAATTEINATLTAHTNNGDIHVTAENKTAWNGKQDAITDLAAIRSNAASGMAAYNNVNALSAATVAHTGNSGIHVTSTEKSTWNGKANTSDITITGLTVGGTNATVTNKVAAVPTASTSAFGVVKVPAQATSFLTNSNGTISVATGTGTNQVAKGSDFAAVSAATTAHTADTTVHVTAANKTTWNGKQDAISDLATIRSNAASGMAAYNNVTALSAGTISELGKKSNTGHTHAISDITNLQTTLNGKSDTGHTHSNYATTGNVSTLSSATQSIQSSAQTAYNSRITGGTITSGATNSITTTNNRVAITAATLPSYSTANNDQVLMIKNGVPQWVTPATITYSSSQPTGGNNGDIWIQTS